jgi:hypothetical protein
MPYDATDYITASLNGEDLKSQYSPVQDFQPLPQFTQTTTSNEQWVNVTTTRTDSDGSVSQSLQIISKR